VAAYDAALPHRMLKRATARRPSPKAGIVRDADHIGAMAQPDDMNARILRFLNA
jgi:hypothetical protein